MLNSTDNGLVFRQFDLASTSKAEQLLLKSRHTFYEFGDKAGEFLAHQARQAAASCQIIQVKTTSGVVTTDYKEINDSFVILYQSIHFRL